MKIDDLVDTGTIVFVYGKTFVSKLVGFFTFGSFSHVAIVYDKTKLYETDGRFFKSRFSDLNEYEDYRMQIITLTWLTDDEKAKIKEICSQRIGTWYGYWNCFLQFAMFPFSSHIKDPVARLLTPNFMTKCDDEVKIVLDGATKNDPHNTGQFSENQSGNPEEFREVLRQTLEVTVTEVN